jgi:hypothetical protein
MNVGDTIQITSKTQMASVLLHSLHKATTGAITKSTLAFEEAWNKTGGVFTVLSYTKDVIQLVSDDWFDSDSDRAVCITLPLVTPLFKKI